MPAHYHPFAAYIGAQATADARRMLSKYRDPRIGYQRLAIAMHFMADCASPFHSSPFDFTAQRYHRTYEDYVAKNMYEGHCFSEILYGSTGMDIMHEYVHDLAAGANHIAGLARASLGPILNRIRTDPFWEKRREIASVTADLLLGALMMCMTQIHVATSCLPENHATSRTIDRSMSYYKQPGALFFYRTHASALLQEYRASVE
jgi:hypothetical protein